MDSEEYKDEEKTQKRKKLTGPDFPVRGPDFPGSRPDFPGVAARKQKRRENRENLKTTTQLADWIKERHNQQLKLEKDVI